MGLGSYNSTTLSRIRESIPRLLAGFTTAQIAETSGNVIRVLTDFKRQHPDKIPTSYGIGLLGGGPFLITDFSLARHLVDSRYPAMLDVIESASGLPVLIAYLEILTYPHDDLPDEAVLEAGFSCVLELERLQSDTAKLFNQHLRSDVLRLAPLAKTGQKFLNGREPGKLGPVAMKIKAFLQKYPKAKPDIVWQHLKKAPPKGLVFMENRLGRYIEKGAKTVMEWSRFRNLVSEHRPKK